MADATAKDITTLMTWLSPAFPVGGFAWSGGLEAAVANGLVTDRDALDQWLATSLSFGTARLDTYAVAALLANPDQSEDVDDALLSMATTPEREAELLGMGDAFVRAARPWAGDENVAAKTYPVAFAQLAGGLSLPATTVLQAFSHHLISAQIQAALRLMPLGQTAGVECLAECSDAISACAVAAQNATIDDLSTSTFAMDIAAMQHRDLPSRIFRS
ncbi:urease accessory protein UreF [Ahrensia sp. R2A130]|uniref:urease accessory protein UreF n=1 Tax=Ahrensia sp. R2A130 TaxID=744979 RepID=UPI0001E0ACAF|nr:urease accessory UreF family protein [Ahrensia sp. R2A130]EFL88670.1 urease accessory protein UreF [Ahrensia sp. R2A130]